MFALFGFLWVLSTIYVGIEQIRYAKRNYPRSMVWRLRLFSSAFCSGFLLTLAIMQGSGDWGRSLLLATLNGVVTGLMFTFGFPYNMQGWYPKRRE
jgi:hypothetical protein